MSGEIVPSEPVDVELEEEDDEPTTNFEEIEDSELDSSEDFQLRMLRNCKKFTKMTSDLDDKRKKSLDKYTNAREVFNQALAAKESARADVTKKESNLRSLRNQLETLQHQIASAEDDLEESREHLEQCVNDEKTANKKFRYSVKEFHKYQAVDQSWVRFLVRFLQGRRTSYVQYSNKAIQ